MSALTITLSATLGPVALSFAAGFVVCKLRCEDRSAALLRMLDLLARHSGLGHADAGDPEQARPGPRSHGRQDTAVPADSRPPAVVRLPHQRTPAQRPRIRRP